MYRRNRLAELYSEEHPAVIALDRQLQHLEQQMSGNEGRSGSNVDLAGYDEATSDINEAGVEQLANEVDSLKKVRDAAWQAVEQAKLANHADSFDFTAVSPVTLGTIQMSGPDRRLMFLATTVCVCSRGRCRVDHSQTVFNCTNGCLASVHSSPGVTR